MTHILKTTLLTTALSAFVAAPAYAGIADGWSGEAALTGSKTTGNTETEDVGLGLNLVKSADTDRLYAYGNADYFQDDFGAFETGYFIGTGVGYKLVLPDPLQWDVEGGLGYRSQKSQELVPVTENELAFRAASNIDYAFNDNVSLYNHSELLYSESDTYIWNETGITAQLQLTNPHNFSR